MTLALWLLVGCGPATHSLKINDITIQVEVADDAGERAKGLMHRDSLPADGGMIFVYEDEAPRSFWMKDTKVPLSIAYASSDGTIVRIADMTPLSLDRVPSLYPAKYALEMNRGWFDEHQIKKGDKLENLPPDPK